VSADAAVQRLLDEAAIRDLVRRYAHYVWRGDARGASDLFSEDCVMDTGDREPIRGRAALLASYSEIFGATEFRPFIHNHVVEVAGDRATGHCDLDLHAVVQGQRMTGFGSYADEYVRTPHGWKIAKRTLEMLRYEQEDDGEPGILA